jgi:hypothetical protein
MLDGLKFESEQAGDPVMQIPSPVPGGLEIGPHDADLAASAQQIPWAAEKRTDGNPWQAVLQPAGFVYYRSDRVVSHGYLPLLNRPVHIVHFFRDVHGIYPITQHAWRRARGQR